MDAAADQENATLALGASPTDVGEGSRQPPVAGHSFSWGRNERERYRVRYVLDSDPPKMSPWDVDTKVDEAEYAARYRPSLTWGAPSPENTCWGTPLLENTALGREHTPWSIVLPQEASSGLDQGVEAIEDVEDSEVDGDGDECVEKKLDIHEDVKGMEDVHGCESLTPLQRDPWGARQSYPGERDENMWEGGWGCIGSVSWVRALYYTLELFLLTFHYRAVLFRSPPPPRIRAWSREIWLV